MQSTVQIQIVSRLKQLRLKLTSQQNHLKINRPGDRNYVTTTG